MVSKQGWCHFEALECIFHLNLKKIPSVNHLTHNQQNTAFPNIWSTLYAQALAFTCLKNSRALIRAPSAAHMSGIYPKVDSTK